VAAFHVSKVWSFGSSKICHPFLFDMFRVWSADFVCRCSKKKWTPAIVRDAVFHQQSSDNDAHYYGDCHKEGHLRSLRHTAKLRGVMTVAQETDGIGRVEMSGLKSSKRALSKLYANEFQPILRID
jgi:hypothetical protein